MPAAFGTSGLRGLVEDLTDGTAARHAAAFIRSEMARGRLQPGGKVFVGEDMRESSPLIARQIYAALTAEGVLPVACGQLPTPALALHAMAAGEPAIMITGSHIPADRNGVKFYRRDGEIDKADETAIAGLALAIPGGKAEAQAEADENAAALQRYRARYAACLPADGLKGLRIGVYQHSTVARDVMMEILGGFGATAVTLARSPVFIPVDTEAVSDTMRADLRRWSKEGGFDAIVSADGDGDRPLLTDEHGECIRGDALGLIAARHCAADAVVTPVTSNSGIEAHVAGRVFRTKVGSPFVIAGMADAASAGAERIVGFEANGGTLTASLLAFGAARLTPLPTRDSVLPLLAALAAARQAGVSLSRLVSGLALPVAASGRLENFPSATGRALVDKLSTDETARKAFFAPLGTVARVDRTDGLRVTLGDGSIIHLRPSGNAPELRCYTEAKDGGQADQLLRRGLELAKAG